MDVERLRWWARHNDEWVSIAPAVLEAADEIERLRTELGHARDLLDAVNDDMGGDYLDTLAEKVSP